MTDLRDWAKLDTKWYDDTELVAAAEEAPAAFVMWPVLIAKAKECSHVTRNPDGMILVTPSKLAFEVRCGVDEVRSALDSLTSNGKIRYTEEGAHKLSITLVGFAKWQKPRGSNADKQQRKNGKKQTFSAKSDTTMTPLRHDDDTTLTPTRHPELDLDLELDVELELDRDNDKRANALAATATQLDEFDAKKQLERIGQHLPSNPLDQVAGEVLANTQTMITEKLAEVMDRDDAARIAGKIVINRIGQAQADKRGGRQKYAAEVWVRAVNVTVRKIKNGLELKGDPTGFIISLLPDYVEPYSDREVVIGKPAADPDNRGGDFSAIRGRSATAPVEGEVA